MNNNKNQTINNYSNCTIDNRVVNNNCTYVNGDVHINTNDKNDSGIVSGMMGLTLLGSFFIPIATIGSLMTIGGTLLMGAFGSTMISDMVKKPIKIDTTDRKSMLAEPERRKLLTSSKYNQ